MRLPIELLSFDVGRAVKAIASFCLGPVLLTAAGSHRLGVANAAPNLEAPDFVGGIQPLLSKRCVSCHGSEKQKGGLRLDRREDFRRGGDSGALAGKPAATGAENSLLIAVLEGTHPDLARMPKDATPLSTAQIELVRAWLAAGAPWPDGVEISPPPRADASWWSLQPMAAVRPPVPSGLPPDWTAPIDRFIGAALKAKELTPSPPSDRRTLIRRMSFDVVGLPPTPEEVHEFVQDRAADAVERLVDRLLANPGYGERWGRLWLDVVRFGESNGYERNVLYPSAWPYRDYVIGALNSDLPFDQFIFEQLAGDTIADRNTNAAIATAFMVCGPYDDVGNQDAAAAAQIRANHLDDMVRATSEAFLGLTVGCARCHDHKFDPIAIEDYYKFQSAFAGVTHGERLIAAPERIAARAAASAQLDRQAKQLVEKREAIENAIVTRAEAANHLHTYALPKVDPYLTEDIFPAIEARLIRWTVIANDRDPRSAGGVRVDEFEVWSDEPQPRNLALATLGAKVSGGSGRIAEDFGSAYGPELAIDGQFGAKWLAPAQPVLTVTLTAPALISRVSFSSDRPRELPRHHDQNTFVGEYRIEVSLDGIEWKTAAESAARPPLSESFDRMRRIRALVSVAENAELEKIVSDLAAHNRQRRAMEPLPAAWIGRMQQPAEPSYVMLGGDPQRRGAGIDPGPPQFLGSALIDGRLATNAPESERRAALARWIAHPHNPLALKVLANRVWQSHFGTGIVDTPSDFGFLGGRPTHPELLDWLANRLVAEGWRLKRLHREILLSQTYRQSGSFRADAAAVDKDARYLWRFPPRRLSAEEIRDSMLFVAGTLAPRSGGPGFRLYRYLEDNVATYVALDKHGPETWRRAIYHQSPRAARVDLLADFDCPDNSIPAPSRTATTSPLQALTLLNHSFTLDMAKLLAARATPGVDGGNAIVSRSAKHSVIAAAVGRVFHLTLNRPPDERELHAAMRLIRDHGLAAFCRAQLNLNEFIYVY